jgi:hypothetical protein
MQSVEKQRLNGAVIFLDDKCFIDCVYDQCTLVFSGGDVSWFNSTFNNCKMQFSGAADRTVNLMRQFGMLKEETFSKPSAPPTKSAGPVN